jgi:hypothetical protein
MLIDFTHERKNNLDTVPIKYEPFKSQNLHLGEVRRLDNIKKEK